MPKKRGSEIQLARGRLKGVLQDLVALSDDEEVSDEPELKYQMPARGRPPKRTRKETPEPVPSIPMHESYIMKLFDRSLDLGKYKESTALYPICRAWIADEPRSTSIQNFRNQRTPSPEIRGNGTDLLDELKNGDINEIVTMPAARKIEMVRVPSPLPEQKDVCKDDIHLDYDLDTPPMTKEELLLEHRKRWKNVRNKWTSHAKSYQQRYLTSLELLEALYKP